jgi:cytochrome c5
MNAETRRQDPFIQKCAWSILAVALSIGVVVMVPRSAHGQARPATGKEVVDRVCIACHGTGVNGAPKIGDNKAWSKRAAQGLTGLTESALKGIRRMPAHGGHPELSDLEIERAITYMVNHSGGHWVEPAGATALATERTGQQVVEAQCSKCHAAGVGGAPKIGDQKAWLPRVRKGIDYLVHSAIHGHGGMPARGGLSNLTDNEIRNAIIYMFNPTAARAREPTPSVEAIEVGPGHMTAAGMDIYLGVAPAQSILAYPKESPERSMHGGVPRGPGYYHVNVTVWDHATSAPINDAHVSVRIEEKTTGAVSETKRLEPIVAGTGSYGNYVRMEKDKSYVIAVQVRNPALAAVANARFGYRIN